MKINRLRLLGFKSFVEPTDLVIEAGLTGVVGPNGCGKSNLLEALRWVMGETSHKSMRAAAMDDVIFSGTTTRPARNSAEVTIFLDNTERLAPAEFNDTDLIEITRRIEREAGSAYRINGREMRARDIKILFEDAATGARSPALVRQGQIAEIVNAKPEQRRRVLEDAAGIAGLHSRRHEAELRLRAAEANVARLTDILGELNTQIEGLKRQTRQAKRYKELSRAIRKSEALQAHLAWTEAHTLVDAEERSLTDALSRLAAAAERESACLREEAELAEAVPPLREAEAVKGAALGRLTIEKDHFEREAERAATRLRELQQRADQLAGDLARETKVLSEATASLAQLDKEISGLVETQSRIEAATGTAGSALEAAAAALGAGEATLSDLAQRASEVRARRSALDSTHRERREAVAKIERQLAALEAQTRDIGARAPDIVKLTTTTETGNKLALEVAELEARAVAAEAKTRKLAQTSRTATEAAQQARLALGAVATERETLSKLLVPLRDDDVPPVVDEILVRPGYEAALAAALGDDLEAPIAPAAPVHWRLVAPTAADDALPSGIEALIDHVKAPPELARRLHQIGVVTREQGEGLQPFLRPGQRLVSVEGDLWRWDGFFAASDGATPAAQRLRERNRLADIENIEAAARREAEEAIAAQKDAAEALHEAEAEEQVLRQTWRETNARFAQTREQLTLIERAARETETKLAGVAEARAAAGDDLIDAVTRLEETTANLSELAAGEDLEPLVAAAREAVAERRGIEQRARSELATLERERDVRTHRLAAARSEQESWRARGQAAEAQAQALTERHREAAEERDSLAELPALIEERRQALLSTLSDAEAERRHAADRLAQAENAARAAVMALRDAQGAVSTEREARARVEARLENARGRRQEEARRIRETFEIAPEQCLTLAEWETGAKLPALPEVERELQKLRADRERLGGVNLQADDELTVLMEQFATLETERGDVDQAISKLRGAIGQLNREGKKRLEEAFTTVNAHFQRLFTTLFNGGEARLEMIESEEDPLEGGLEIIAKPPGKKPVTLSLLSGGEQSLTALSLIFAVFLTNPSPICVLDEVDAPLDDANVDRFCLLMEQMATETATRFLVITHHPMTMTRMNRLFGVTMAERGISQLVSVDLETAQGFREAG